MSKQRQGIIQEKFDMQPGAYRAVLKSGRQVAKAKLFAEGSAAENFAAAQGYIDEHMAPESAESTAATTEPVETPETEAARAQADEEIPF